MSRDMTPRWRGEKPTTCQLCEQPLVDTFRDAPTKFGPWALMCERCYTTDAWPMGQQYSMKKPYLKIGDK